MSVFLLSWLIVPACQAHLLWQRYIVICGLSCCTVFFYIISQKARFFKKKLMEQKMCFDFLYNVFRKTSGSKKDSTRYCHKCA